MALFISLCLLIGVIIAGNMASKDLKNPPAKEAPRLNLTSWRLDKPGVQRAWYHITNNGVEIELYLNWYEDDLLTNSVTVGLKDLKEFTLRNLAESQWTPEIHDLIQQATDHWFSTGRAHAQAVDASKPSLLDIFLGKQPSETSLSPAELNTDSENGISRTSSRMTGDSENKPQQPLRSN